MHPKTFHVIIRKPFGSLTRHSLCLYVHGQSWQDTLAWVEATFPGVDIRPSVRANYPEGLRVGNNDPLSIQDLDKFGLIKREGGKLVREKAPEGYWRRSVEDVASELHKAATFLSEQSDALSRSFEGVRREYESGEAQSWVYERLVEMKKAIERADVWQANLWRQYADAMPNRGLELPALRQTSAQPDSEADTSLRDNGTSMALAH